MLVAYAARRMLVTDSVGQWRQVKGYAGIGSIYMANWVKMLAAY
jgi:hypothetical protein